MDAVLVPDYAAFHRVTSDCKPWRAGGKLAVCVTCGSAQAVLDEQWHAEARDIYDHYTIYHTSKGVEQSVFDQASGQAMSRSSRLVKRFLSELLLPPRGRLLDVGCGNGAFLRAFSGATSGWALAGVEVNDHYRPVVEAIPAVERLYVGDLNAVPGSFQVISLIHALEHIPTPRNFVLRLAEKLEPGGLLIVQVPDCQANAFMYLVADHASHFYVATLRELVASAGYEVVVAANDWVAKEITIIARKPAAPIAVRAMTRTVATEVVVRARLAWLQEIVARTRRLAAGGNFGLFGTSIAATWLYGELDGRVEFFVDEDPHRVGQTHLGRPVLAPSQAPVDSDVFLALPLFLAQSIAARWASAPARWHFPGELQD